MKRFIAVVVLAVLCSSAYGQDWYKPSDKIGRAVVVVISDSVINASVGNAFTKTIAANQRFIVNNMVDGQTIHVYVTNTASNYTITWVTSVTWDDGITPVQAGGAMTYHYALTYLGGTIYGSDVNKMRLANLKTLAVQIDSVTQVDTDTLAIWVGGTAFILPVRP